MVDTDMQIAPAANVFNPFIFVAAFSSLIANANIIAPINAPSAPTRRVQVLINVITLLNIVLAFVVEREKIPRFCTAARIINPDTIIRTAFS